MFTFYDPPEHGRITEADAILRRQEKAQRDLFAAQKPHCHRCGKAGKDCADSLACTVRILKSLKPPKRWSDPQRQREEYERVMAAA